MTGLIGVILVWLFTFIAALIFAVIGIYNLFVSVPDWKLISASFAALLTTLVLAQLVENPLFRIPWFRAPAKWHDLMGFLSPVLALAVAVFVYNRV